MSWLWHPLCLLALLVLSTCHANDSHGSSHAPEWLLDLPQLLQHEQLQQQHRQDAAVTSSVLSHDAVHTYRQSQLLRPKSLPHLRTTAQLASLQQQSTQRQATLASVARSYGVAPKHLQSLMQQDPSLLVTKQGLLVWACEGPHASHGVHEQADIRQNRDKDSSSSSVGDGDGYGDGGVDGSGGGGGGHATNLQKSFLHDSTGGLVASITSTAEGLAHSMFEGPFTTITPPVLEVNPEGWCAPTQDTADFDPASSVFLQSFGAHPANAATQKSPHLVVQQPGPQPQPQDAFKLHTRAPGTAQHTIHLNFRGCTISNTYWNTATKKAVLVTEPYDLDGAPSTFSTQEQQAIITIWQSVAQDFASWAVDVTTEDPGEDALLRDSESDTEYGMLVCVGGSSMTTVGGMSGGLSFTGAWGQLGSALQPVLVFPEQLGNGHPRAVADSISHEIGHTVGLAHFGGAGAAPYNDGSGPWGPLLGLPYGRVLSQWSRGTAVTGTLQDDLSLISQHLTRLADDHGDSAATATALCHDGQQQGAGLQQARGKGSCKRVQLQQDQGQADLGHAQALRALVRGTISDSTDTDWFKVVTGSAGWMQVKLQLPNSAAGYGVNNLLAAVQIMSADGTQVLAETQPETGSETVLQTSTQLQQSGAYYVVVRPTGIAEVSSYGSLGDYLLSVTFPSGTDLITGPVAASNAAAPHWPAPVLGPGKPMQGCQEVHCAPCKGCGWCASADAQQCTCAAHRGLVPRLIASPATSSGQQLAVSEGATNPTCQFQQVKALSFSTQACSTAMAGALVLLNFTVSNPPGCFEGSILAAAPTAQLVQDCPCQSSPQTFAYALPVPQSGSAVATNGAYTCRAGMYSYTWQVPARTGCYRLRIALIDRSSVVTLLQVVEASLVTQAAAADM